MSDDWQKQADWMRKNGVVSAQWAAHPTTPYILQLTHCVLGPEPQTAAPSLEETAEVYKERMEREIKERQQRLDDLDFGAS